MFQGVKRIPLIYSKVQWKATGFAVKFKDTLRQ